MSAAKKSPASATRTKEGRTAGNVGAKATTPWACLEPGCPEHGDTQATAEKHTKAGHATTTASTPDRAAAIAARAGDGRRK